MNDTKKPSEPAQARSAFWDGVRESAKAVQAGPEWMRAGITLNDEHFVTYAPEQAPASTKPTTKK